MTQSLSPSPLQPVAESTLLLPPEQVHPESENLEEATVFMVISCHCRIAEIYEKVFAMKQACIKYSLVPERGEGWAVVLPRIEIGGFKVESVRGESS
jgi:hypothetical protein